MLGGRFEAPRFSVGFWLFFCREGGKKTVSAYFPEVQVNIRLGRRGDGEAFLICLCDDLMVRVCVCICMHTSISVARTRACMQVSGCKQKGLLMPRFSRPLEVEMSFLGLLTSPFSQCQQTLPPLPSVGSMQSEFTIKTKGKSPSRLFMNKAHCLCLSEAFVPTFTGSKKKSPYRQDRTKQI